MIFVEDKISRLVAVKVFTDSSWKEMTWWWRGISWNLLPGLIIIWFCAWLYYHDIHNVNGTLHTE